MRLNLGSPSLVICFAPKIRGGGNGARSHRASPASTMSIAASPAHFNHHAAGFDAEIEAKSATLVTALRPESVSRFRRLRLVSRSAAEGYRKFRSFSRHLLMIRSKSAG